MRLARDASKAFIYGPTSKKPLWSEAAPPATTYCTLSSGSARPRPMPPRPSIAKDRGEVRTQQGKSRRRLQADACNLVEGGECVRPERHLQALVPPRGPEAPMRVVHQPLNVLFSFHPCMAIRRSFGRSHLREVQPGMPQSQVRGRNARTRIHTNSVSNTQRSQVIGQIESRHTVFRYKIE